MVSIAGMKFWRLAFIAVFVGFLFSGKVLAEPYRLNSGELLSDSSYQTSYGFGSGKGLVLEVSFAEDPPSEEVRRQSMFEILTAHLIPSAVKNGYDSASVWEERATAKSKSIGGLFSFAGEVFENYDFELGENWEWQQVAGPELDFSDYLRAEYKLDEEVGALITPLVERSVKSGEKYYSASLVYEGGSPRESLEKANKLFQKLSGCSSIGGPIKQDSYLGKTEAIALVVRTYPAVPDGKLRFMPNLRLNFGHTDGELNCDWPSPDEETSETWDEVYASLSEK